MKVQAIGLNILPSIPCRVSTGRKTRTMIPMPKTIGRTTSWLEARMVSNRSATERGLFNCIWRSVSRLRFASVMTTEPSTRMPKSIAPSESRLAAIPISCIPRAAKSIAMGMVAATSRPARRLPSKRNRTAMTSRAPAVKLCLTVWITWSTSSVRS